VSRRPAALLLVGLLLAVFLATGCLSPEQKMVLKVESFMEQQKYAPALSYLERYLGRYGKSLAAWRYRVLIRLEQEQRPAAAAEYAALSRALGRHEPGVLREVVLGAGGRWLLSDYAMLARCGSDGLVDAAFFEQLLTAQHLGSGSMSKVAVSDDEIAAVLDALPGALDPTATWLLVDGQSGADSTALRSRLVAAAGRHLASGTLGDEVAKVALGWISEASAESDPRLREAALRAGLLLPQGAGLADFAASMVDSLVAAADSPRALSVFLMGPSLAGPAGWSPAHLERWASAGAEPLATFALAAQQHSASSRAGTRTLRAAAGSGDAGRRLAAATAPGADAAAVWASLHVEERRLWGPAMVRSAAGDGGTWASLVLSDSDSLVVQGAATALALRVPGGAGAELISEPLRTALGARDASSRAAAARAVILRGVAGLKPDIEALAERGDDRVMLAALAALVETGAAGWESVVAAGLRSELPLVREQAVDAAAAGCNSEQRGLLTALLVDDDPHVAVRAAAVLYLSVGSD
jgi:hypothetical protein